MMAASARGSTRRRYIYDANDERLGTIDDADNVLFNTENGDVGSRETGEVIWNLFDDFF